MSQSMRPVREEWGEATDLFLEPSEVETLLQGVSDYLKIDNMRNDYGDVVSVHIGEGSPFLNFIESPTFTAEWYANNIDDCDEDNLKSLVGNMKLLVPVWRQSIGTHGELIFYVD